MLKTLIVLVWPIGIAALLVLSALLARRLGPRPERAPASANRLATASVNGQYGSDAGISPRSAWSSVVGMLLILTVGAVAVYALICLLGLLVVHAGPSIDKPMYTWMLHHRVHFWASVMNRLTKVGNTWTTWGAAGAAAVCLAAFYRKNKWLPPAVFAAAIFVDHYLTLALRHTFHRLGPPNSPDGTFPSGGCDRIFVFYGLIAYLIWREIGGSKRVAIWSAGVVAALGFSEAYSRFYLTLHWFTDAISGIIYGCLILAVFIATIRLVIGPARRPLVGTAPVLPTGAAGQPAPTLQ
jgi:membrane-associated phospholipid phosphatase